MTTKLPLARTVGSDANFYRTVRQLRGMAPDHALQALFAAFFWSDEKLDDAELAGDLPGQSGVVKPEAVSMQ
jgi:hypothetical protein